MYIKAYKDLIGLYRFIIAYKGMYWWSFPFKMLEMLETFETFQMDLDAPPPWGGMCVSPPAAAGAWVAERMVGLPALRGVAGPMRLVQASFSRFGYMFQG